MPKSITIGELFTDAELAKARLLWKRGIRDGELKAAIEQDIVVPDLKEIEARAGQEMDPGYVAYILVYYLDQLDVYEGSK